MPWRALTDLWLLGRRTSSLDCPRILEEETVGTWECGGGRRGWKVCGADSAHQQSQILHIHPWRMGTLEQSPWKVKLWENFRGKIWEDEKKPRWRVHSFVHSFAHSLITVYWLPPTCQHLFWMLRILHCARYAVLWSSWSLLERRQLTNKKLRDKHKLLSA